MLHLALFLRYCHLLSQKSKSVVALFTKCILVTISTECTSSTMKIKMSSDIVWKHPRRVQCLVGCLAASSRTSGQQQRTLDGRRCWAGSTARRVDCCWQSADDDETWRWKLACSGLSDTVGLGSAGIGREAHQACIWLTLEHRAHEARCVEVVTEHGHHWRHVQHPLQPVGYILLCPSEDCVTVVYAGRHKAWTSVQDSLCCSLRHLGNHMLMSLKILI